MPSEAFFERVYREDAKNRERQTLEDYMIWVLRFYEGYQINPGWKRVEEQIARDLTQDEYLLLLPKVSHLGQVVCAEWAKSNGTRRISVEHVVIWIDVLKQGKKAKRLEATIERLLSDVEGIVVGRIDSKSIRRADYPDAPLPKEPGDAASGPPERSSGNGNDRGE